MKTVVGELVDLIGGKANANGSRGKLMSAKNKLTALIHKDEQESSILSKQSMIATGSTNKRKSVKYDPAACRGGHFQ